VAGRPLRPATRRRLGRPSPHQQADRPRAHPQPKKLSTPHQAMRSEYPVLDPVSQAYPEAEGRSPTCYSPVRRSCTPKEALPLDLHVLSTPPAFVLSQDQTLQQKLALSTPQTRTTKTTRPRAHIKLAQHHQFQKQARHTVEFSKDTRTPPTNQTNGQQVGACCLSVTPTYRKLFPGRASQRA
jgi:hypothetical protein